MQVETDKCLCNYADVCSREDKHMCTHAKPHRLRSYCNLLTKCRERRGVFCAPIMKEATPDWEV